MAGAMMKFRVGDPAMGQNFTKEHSIQLNGRRCTIIGELKLNVGIDRSTGERRTGLGYRVCWDDGVVGCVRPHHLKFAPAKPRAIDRVVPWSICAWRPSNPERDKS